MECARRKIWTKVILFPLAICVVTASLEVEHSIGGSPFRPAGKLVGNLQSDMEFEWQRPALTPTEIELVEKSAASDGLYSVRIKTDKGSLLSSVPAKCLLLQDFTEQAVLHAGHEGFIEAFNYDVESCSSSVAADGSISDGYGGSSGDGGVMARPERLPVRVKLPVPGPFLSMPEVMGEFADISVDAMEAGGLAGAAFDPNAKPRAVPSNSAGGQAGAKKGGPPPKDERTWLQKNWLYVVAIGMMVLNVLAKAQQPQQGGPAPAGGAGAAARRS
ncbi:hypothetical protein Vretifemale_6153 [Volvox reticuliferus]|uniref:ER membrane protein complex subunit 10 n=2 Tax=Volvox reticuliferus TaxID=1737510 RepID=A0A8J4FKZ5_9CHLO|nr:hypothetical protein Vretifemale_6153 [Volvox reticuliferus]